MLKIPKLLHLVIIRGKTEWSVANILIGTPRDITFSPMINQAEEKYVYHFVCLFMPHGDFAPPLLPILMALT